MWPVVIVLDSTELEIIIKQVPVETCMVVHDGKQHSGGWSWGITSSNIACDIETVSESKAKWMNRRKVYWTAFLSKFPGLFFPELHSLCGQWIDSEHMLLGWMSQPFQVGGPYDYGAMYLTAGFRFALLLLRSASDPQPLCLLHAYALIIPWRAHILFQLHNSALLPFR